MHEVCRIIFEYFGLFAECINLQNSYKTNANDKN